MQKSSPSRLGIPAIHPSEQKDARQIGFIFPKDFWGEHKKDLSCHHLGIYIYIYKHIYIHIYSYIYIWESPVLKKIILRR